MDSAISAAIRDPRFPPVEEDELDDMIVEVTILTLLKESMHLQKNFKTL